MNVVCQTSQCVHLSNLNEFINLLFIVYQSSHTHFTGLYFICNVIKTIMFHSVIHLPSYSTETHIKTCSLYSRWVGVYDTDVQMPFSLYKSNILNVLNTINKLTSLMFHSTRASKCRGNV